MAVEKMHLVNITSRLENLDSFLEDVIELGDIEPVDAFNQVASRAFSIRASKENVELTEDISTISSFEKPNKTIIDKLNVMKDFFNIENVTNNKNKFIEADNVDEIYDNLQALIDKKNELEKKLDKLYEYKANLEILDKYGIDISKVKNLKYFDHRFGEVSKDGRFILKNNYDNIPSLILHLDNSLDNMSLDYLDELISLDNETAKLRRDTDQIVGNEKDNTFKVISELDRKYQNLTKSKSDEAYTSIMNEAEAKKSEIDDEYKAKKEKLGKIYDDHSDDIVNDVTKSILEERYR